MAIAHGRHHKYDAKKIPAIFNLPLLSFCDILWPETTDGGYRIMPTVASHAKIATARLTHHPNAHTHATECVAACHFQTQRVLVPSYRQDASRRCLTSNGYQSVTIGWILWIMTMIWWKQPKNHQALSHTTIRMKTKLHLNCCLYHYENGIMRRQDKLCIIETKKDTHCTVHFRSIWKRPSRHWWTQP